MQEHLNFYMNNIHTYGIKKKEIYSYCSIDKQFVEGVQKRWG